MHHLIGFGLIIVGGVLAAVTDIMAFVAILLVGVFLFASIFVDGDPDVMYILPSGDEALLRYRRYICFLPFYIVTLVLTLGKAPLMIVCREVYYRAKMRGDEEEPELILLTRKEYVAQRNEQRQIYASGTLTKEFFEKAYGGAAGIGYRRKKGRLIAAIVLALLMLTGLTEPGGIYLVLLYEAVFVPMILLWYPDYIDVKIQQAAYDRAKDTGNG